MLRLGNLFGAMTNPWEKVEPCSELQGADLTDWVFALSVRNYLSKGPSKYLRARSPLSHMRAREARAEWAKAACACSGRFLPVYSPDARGGEHLRGGEHEAGAIRQEALTGGAADNRQELAERGFADPDDRAPAGFGLPGQVQR